MIVFENYKKEKPKNTYGRFFLAEEAPGDESEEEYTPPRPRKAKIITVKPNNRRTLDFSAGAEDLMNDPNLDNINFDLGGGADPETDDLPDVNNLFNNPAINNPLNIPNDDVTQTDNPDQLPDETTPPEDTTGVEEPSTDDLNNPPVDEPTETPPEENPPVDTPDVNTDINNPDPTRTDIGTEPATDVNNEIPPEPVDVNPAPVPEPDMTTDVNTPPVETPPATEPVPDVNTTPDATAPAPDVTTTPDVTADVGTTPPTDVNAPAPETPPADPNAVPPAPDATMDNPAPDAGATPPATPDATNPTPDQNQVITPDSGGGDDMGTTDFSTGGEGGDDMGLGADAGAAGGDATAGTDQNQQNGVGVGLDTMRKYTLFNEFINFGNAITNYIEKLENLVMDDPGQNQVIKYVINTLHNIKDMIYDYINMKFELSTYFAARTFFDEMYVATQVTIGMLSRLKDIVEDKNDKK